MLLLLCTGIQDFQIKSDPSSRTGAADRLEGHLSPADTEERLYRSLPGLFYPPFSVLSVRRAEVWRFLFSSYDLILKFRVLMQMEQRQ